MVWDLIVQRLSNALSGVVENFLVGFVDVLVVLLFIILGWVVGNVLVDALKSFFKQIKFDKSLKKRGLETSLLGFSLETVLEKFVKLMTYAAFLGIAADVVNLTFLGELVYWFVGYVPLFIQGVVIMLVALLAVGYVTKHLRDSKAPFANLTASFLQVLVGYVALVMALPLILPNADVGLLSTAFTLFLLALAVALGLGLAIALGLGLKDTVASVAKKKQSDFEKII